MKNILFFALLLTSVIFFPSCDDDGDDPTTDFDYHAHINSPNTDDKHLNDTIQIAIDFESHTNEVVHHANVLIYNLADSTIVYNKPDAAHVHEEDGLYEFTDELVLSNINGFSEHSDWILQAKVWGDGLGVGEVIETVQFHVHPE